MQELQMEATFRSPEEKPVHGVQPFYLGGQGVAMEAPPIMANYTDYNRTFGGKAEKMREIKFRGKRTDNGEWVEGLFFKEYSTFFKKFLFIIQHLNKFGIPIANYEILPETVGEYTGLTDKNGTEIFEGDIVKRVFTLWHGETKKTRETQIGVVVYSNRDCSFQVEKKCNLRKPWDGDTIEVIGNIHDNPELLEREAEE